jgi:hypothetical protein
MANSMKRISSWEANSHSANQEIACLLWNLKFHYWVYKSLLPLVPVWSQMKQPHCLCFLKTNCNINIWSVCRSSKWCFPLYVLKPKLSLHFSAIPCNFRPCHTSWLIYHDILLKSENHETSCCAFFLAFCHFIPPGSKYYQQHLDPKHVHVFSVWKTKFHTHTKWQVKL